MVKAKRAFFYSYPAIADLQASLALNNDVAVPRAQFDLSNVPTGGASYISTSPHRWMRCRVAAILGGKEAIGHTGAGWVGLRRHR